MVEPKMLLSQGHQIVKTARGGAGTTMLLSSTQSSSHKVICHNAAFTQLCLCTQNNINAHPIHMVCAMRVVTWHGPGQIVGYPVMDLSRFKRSVRWYVDALEETIIKTLHHFGIEGHRTSDVGVWVEGTRKVAAIGISVSRWTTMHGTCKVFFTRSILCFSLSFLCFLSLSPFAKVFEKPPPLSLSLSLCSLLFSLHYILHHTTPPLHLQDAVDD